ncbi:MAG: 3-beta hydroxysteroid dehydrogenase [Lysobacterales bacterium]|jgi:nucleoside-diphosphate-sugar epimerase|nr:MAG: 3-beta hydroxysteroid dehydrogenase [Xanthomonadales bacterium]
MRVLVTGGSGFLGQAICRRLHARGDEVVSLARARNDALDKLGIAQIEADITSYDAVVDAMEGFDAVIHCAAKVGPWGRLSEFYQVNVLGTDHVLAGCTVHGIRRLVFTSTSTVVHDGQDINAGRETLPYATHFRAHYPATKAIAERRVLRANGPELATVALRPHLVWGPGDPNLLPRLVERSRKGRLRLVGKPGKRVDHVHVENAALAHLLALDRLEPGSPIAGRVYFITQGEPLEIGEFLNALLQAARAPTVEKRWPLSIAYAFAAGSELLWSLLRLKGEPPLTRFIVSQLASAHWFAIEAARRDLGYEPEIRTKEGLEQLSRWLLYHPQ